MERRQIIIFGGVFAFVVGILVIAYFAFLRPSFSVLYENVREADAAAIIEELESQGIVYRLADNGHAVLVPRNDVDRARVAVAGSDIALGGVVGFELFNESDMGLTEFAQKVNYQRALQGELARTIMMMEGISFARVHLAIPERALFRASATVPTAAVTIQAERGRPISTDRVMGIRRLVSSTVTDLSVRNVAILDDRGELLTPLVETQLGEGNKLDERTALEEYYRARAQAAVRKLLPAVPFVIRVSVIGDSSTAGRLDKNREDIAEEQKSRNFTLRVALRTESGVESEDQILVQEVIGMSIGFDPSRGDILRFETGPLDLAETGRLVPRKTLEPTPASNANAVIPVASPQSPVQQILAGATSVWALLALLALAALGWIFLQRRTRLTPEEHQSFAQILGEKLMAQEMPDHGQ